MKYQVILHPHALFYNSCKQNSSSSTFRAPPTAEVSIKTRFQLGRCARMAPCQSEIVWYPQRRL